MREPQFVADLTERLHGKPEGAELLPPLPKRFLKKKMPNYMKKGLYRSFFVHVALVLLFPTVALVQRITGWESEADARRKAMQMARTAIRVDVVDLPSLKLSELEKVDLTQEVDPGKEAEPVEEEKPSETAMVDRTKELEAKAKAEETKKAAELAKKKTEEDTRRKDAAERVKELQKRLSADAKRRELIEKLKGKKGSGEGRVALGGNIKSEGYSTTGDIATQGDVYTGKALAHVKKFWNVPPWMTASALAASVVVKIGPDGRVLSKRFVKRSGNNEFDGYVERTLEMADPLPAPPEDLKVSYMEDGIEWRFP